jgi:uncharacterized protein (TIGR02270 family)
MESVEAVTSGVCDDLARQAAFLWLLRDHAVRDTAYDLADLCALDDRLEACLDTLRLAGDAGWKACRDLIPDAEGGEVFGAAVVAIERWNLRGLARVLDVGARAPDVARGLASALGWTPLVEVRKLLPGLLSTRVSPPLLWLGITACAVHRCDPGPALGFALTGADARLRARALRAVGELGRVDLVPEVRDALANEDEACRFWAAWSAALLGDDAAARALWSFAISQGPYAERAATVAMRRMDGATGCQWVQTLAKASATPRVPMAAAAALGDPSLVPWLIESMQVLETARLAGGAVTMITGIDLVAEKLTTRPPKDFQAGPTDEVGDENVAMDPDESLPWPDPAKVAAFWQRRGAEFKRGTRYLLGGAMTIDWLDRVLRTGSQPARTAAAMELATRQPGTKLFEVRAPGHVQRQALGTT